MGSPGWEEEEWRALSPIERMGDKLAGARHGESKPKGTVWPGQRDKAEELRTGVSATGVQRGP